jgi:hypothetical protein
MLGYRLNKAKDISIKTFIKYNYVHPRNINTNTEIYTWTKEEILKCLGRYRKTKVPCSCYMCGHRRKIYGRTIQERRFYQSEGE